MTDTDRPPAIIEEVTVNGHKVKCLNDTGLEFDAIVAPHLVRAEDITDQTITIQCASRDITPIELKVAHIDIESSFVVGRIPAAILESATYDVMLGCKYIFLGNPKEPIKACPVQTRSEKKKEEEETGI